MAAHTARIGCACGKGDKRRKGDGGHQSGRGKHGKSFGASDRGAGTLERLGLVLGRRVGRHHAASTSRRKTASRALKASGRSIITAWPVAGKVTKRDPAIP